MTPRRRKQINRKERRERDARRSRMGQQRYTGLVRDLVSMVQAAFQAGLTASLFGLEGPMRAAIRSDLCLQGWRWCQADMLARGALADVFCIIGAERPSWNEGQPEWTIEAGTLIERTRCARCHKPLPDGRMKFCGNLCKSSYHNRLSQFRKANEETAVRMAVKLE